MSERPLTVLRSWKYKPVPRSKIVAKADRGKLRQNSVGAGDEVSVRVHIGRNTFLRLQVIKGHHLSDVTFAFLSIKSQKYTHGTELFSINSREL